MEQVHHELGGWQHPAHRRGVDRAHVDRHHLDGVPPRRGSLGQPVRGVISGAALHLPQQPLIPGQVEEARVPAVREQHVLPAALIDPPAGPAAAVLINPQMRHQLQAAAPAPDPARPANAWCTTGHDSPHSRAACATVRPPSATRPAACSRSRAVTRHRGGTCATDSVNVSARARRLPAFQPPLHPHHATCPWPQRISAGRVVTYPFTRRRHRPAAGTRRRLRSRRHHPHRPAAAGLGIHLSDLHAIQREQPRRHILTHVPVAL